MDESKMNAVEAMPDPSRRKFLNSAALAGLAGDRTSLGFVAETESQVVEHLESHLHELPPDDARLAVVEAVDRLPDASAAIGDDGYAGCLSLERGDAEVLFGRDDERARAGICPA